MREIKSGIFVETNLWGCNPGVVISGGKAVLIDSPLRPDLALEWRNEIEKKSDILCLINTEHHIDHTASNYIFQDKPIISHKILREALSDSNPDEIRQQVLSIYREPINLPPDFKIVLPSITFEDNLVIHLDDVTLDIRHTPGHTSGQSSVYIPERKVIFTGDNIFHSVQTFLQDALPYDWLLSLEQLETMDVEVIVPGHGDICDLSYVPQQASFIREWLDAIENALAKQWSLEEAKEKISFVDRYPMDLGLEELGPRLQQMNVDRLYPLMKNRKAGT